MKPIRLSQTVFDAVKQYPELVEIIADLGFTQVRNSFMLRTLGKRFSLNQAISRSGLKREYIIDLLMSKGFQVEE